MLADVLKTSIDVSRVVVRVAVVDAVRGIERRCKADPALVLLLDRLERE